MDILCPLYPTSDMIFGHAVQMKNSLGKEFDLHWRPFNSCREDYEEDFWDGAIPVKMANVISLAPNTTDMLFHVIIHGMALESGSVNPLDCRRDNRD